MVVSEGTYTTAKRKDIYRLNPCFDGWWYRRILVIVLCLTTILVLILVLMDGGIGGIY